MDSTRVPRLATAIAEVARKTRGGNDKPGQILLEGSEVLLSAIQDLDGDAMSDCLNATAGSPESSFDLSPGSWELG